MRTLDYHLFLCGLGQPGDEAAMLLYCCCGQRTLARKAKMLAWTLPRLVERCTCCSGLQLRSCNEDAECVG